MECIERRHINVHTPFTSFRARQCVRNGKIWPITEWKEGPNVEVTAVVRLEDGNIPLSHLLVHGIGLDFRGNARRYEEIWLEWIVGDICHLKELFPVAQFWVGAVHWPRNNISTMHHLNRSSDEVYYPSLLPFC